MQITVHSMSDDLARKLKEEAVRKGLSLNKTIKQVLERSMGLSENRNDIPEFKELCGIWTAAQADEFALGIADLSTVDPGDWA